MSKLNHSLYNQQSLHRAHDSIRDDYSSLLVVELSHCSINTMASFLVVDTGCRVINCIFHHITRSLLPFCWHFTVKEQKCHASLEAIFVSSNSWMLRLISSFCQFSFILSSFTKVLCVVSLESSFIRNC